ncbi:MAG: hypothetical protein KIG43_02850 [Eubacteriales bacterium]|nr:hypothetical protein [Eubacteriales bacterium]
MINKKELITITFNKYYFENFSSNTPFDINNPRYVLALDGVDSVLERIVVSSPYSLAIEDFDNVDLVMLYCTLGFCN